MMCRSKRIAAYCIDAMFEVKYCIVEPSLIFKEPYNYINAVFRSCCSMLQCVATRCNVLRNCVVRDSPLSPLRFPQSRVTLPKQCVAVCCTVLQHVAVCCIDVFFEAVSTALFDMQR